MRAVDLCLRACGGEPLRVRALAQGFRKSARGGMELQQERQGGITLPPESMLWLGGAVLALLSVFLAIATVLARSRPDLIAFTLAGVTSLVALAVTLGIGLPSLLADDDARTIGWWPLSRRDIGLARLVVVLRPSLGACLTVSALPLLAFAIVGPAPVLSAIALASGLALQCAALTLAIGSTVIAMVRLAGRRRVKRLLVGLLVAAIAGTILAAILAATFAHEPQSRTTPDRLDLAEIGAMPEALPTTWFAAWGYLGTDRSAPHLVALSLVVTLAAAPICFRLASGAGIDDRAEVPSAVPARSLFVRVTAAWLTPFTRGREGWVVRRLLVAHLRDGGVVGLLRFVPMLIVLLPVLVSLAPDSSLDVFSKGGPPIFVRPVVAFVIAAIYAALGAVAVPLGSQHHLAAWFLAQGGLDPARVVATLRGCGRALFLAPILVTLIALHVRAGTPALLAISDSLVVVLMFETVSALLAMRHLAWPFSRPRGSPPDDMVVILAVAVMPLAAIVALWLTLVHDRAWWGQALTCVLLGIALASSRRALVRAVNADGLRLSLVPSAG